MAAVTSSPSFPSCLILPLFVFLILLKIENDVDNDKMGNDHRSQII